MRDNVTETVLADSFGSLTLLTAYIMRTTGATYEQAEEIVYNLDADLERRLAEIMEDAE